MTNDNKNSLVKDMTQGKPGAIIFKFAVPLMLGNVLQQVYIFVDTLVVGQVLGINALAALGVTEWVIFFMFAGIQGIVQGFSIIIAQYFGAENNKGLRNAVYNGMCLVLLLLFMFTLAGQCMIVPMMNLLRTPNEIKTLAVSYLRIIYMGIPLTFLYNYFASIFRAIGNSKIPLHAITISSIVNIVLDLVFVVVFKWGIKGAAFATLISMAISVFYCLIKYKNFEILHIQKEERKIEFVIVKEQLKVGIPMGLQNAITSVGGMVVQSVINGFGVVFIAGYTAANKLYGLLEIAASSYGYAMNTFVGQNKGAGKIHRLKEGFISGNLLGIVTAYGMSAIMLLFGKNILSFFITGNKEIVKEAIQKGYQFLIVLSIFFPLLYILYITRAWIQGTGNTTWAMLSSVVQLVMRVGCALILTTFLGETAIYIGEVAAWLGADVMLFCVYLKIYRAYRKTYPIKERIVTVTVDRPLGSYHPEYRDMYYPINYGYIEGIMAPDGEEQDAYILGLDVPVEKFTGKIIAIVYRNDDVEEKWVVCPENRNFSAEDIQKQIYFQEQYFDSHIRME